MIRIYRGIPGSGKSWQAANWPTKNRVIVCSADNFFIDFRGSYIYDPKRIGEAHAQCFRHFLETLNALIPPDNIAVDNTNIMAWEIAPYVAAANAYGIECEIVKVLCPFEIAAARNVHKVPAEIVWNMHQRLHTEILPPFWKHVVIYHDKEKS